VLTVQPDPYPTQSSWDADLNLGQVTLGRGSALCVSDLNLLQGFGSWRRTIEHFMFPHPHLFFLVNFLHRFVCATFEILKNLTDD
jgi:hypothetical protein